MYKSIKLFECPTFELSKLYQRVWKNDGGSMMHYKLYKILSDISELLTLFAAKRIDIEQLHKYILDDVDMYIKLNVGMFDIQNPCPVGDKTDINSEDFVC